MMNVNGVLRQLTPWMKSRLDLQDTLDIMIFVPIVIFLVTVCVVNDNAYIACELPKYSSFTRTCYT